MNEQSDALAMISGFFLAIRAGLMERYSKWRMKLNVKRRLSRSL